ncbi:AAA family ATPase [Dactylosporangium sp. NPDC050688]|uniref:AAA family ATPase n=1 Tax=Dactylosporangium sp. NPDC050688 TaxID=3157217 RepID=UPI0033C30717
MPSRRVVQPLLTWDDIAGAADLPIEARDLLERILTQYQTRADSVELIGDRRWFLKHVSVRGHIGIGEEALSFSVPPVPGVIFISARNGVGKTSCADAIRFVMSNGNARSYKVVDRNVHFGSRDIRVVVTDGDVDATLGYSPDRGIFYEAASGESRPVSADWEKEFARFRPVLLYPEISSVISEPSLLHVFLGEGLALDVLVRLLEDAGKIDRDSKAAERRVAAAAGAMREELKSLAPDHQLHDLVSQLRPMPTIGEISAIEAAIAALPTAQSPSIDNLSPRWSVDDVRAAGLRGSASELEGSRTSLVPDAHEAYNALAYLSSARESSYLDSYLESDECPVCGSVERQWSAKVRESVDRLRSNLARVHGLEARIRVQWEEFRNSSIPSRISEQTKALLNYHGKTEIAAEWDELVALVEGIHPETFSTDLLDAVCTRSANLAEVYESFRLSVGNEEASKQQSSVRIRIAFDQWKNALKEDGQAVRDLDAARRLVRWADRKLRDARQALFEPIADEVRRLWTDLSADSDLTVSGLRLAGGTRAAKKIEIDILLSGIPVEAGADTMAVLSTGQRNALTLATYFPRAAQDHSPFRFLLLDDPVQAFDPWRVRYLARLIAAYAERFQIIVMSHDDRLWAELSNLGVVRHHIRLDRPVNELSRVVAAETSPGLQYLLDLEKVVESEHRFPVGTERAATAMVLAMCRLAVDTEVGIRLEVLGRRAGLDELEISGDRDAAVDTRSQIDLLNRYASRCGLGGIDVALHKPTIDALNRGSHGQAVNGARASRRHWIRTTRTLVVAIQALEIQHGVQVDGFGHD